VRSGHVTGSSIGPVNVSGSVIGGSGGQYSGSILTYGTMGLVNIKGSLRGGIGAFGGLVVADNNLAGATIGGSLIGGSGNATGAIGGKDVGAIVIGGHVKGGSGINSGYVAAQNNLTSLTIGGSLQGSNGANSGSVEVGGSTTGILKVTGNVNGGSGLESGRIMVNEKAANIQIGGSIRGGTNNLTGIVASDGTITSITVNGNIVGGNASGSQDLNWSGGIFGERILTLVLNGSLIAGRDKTTGTYSLSGVIGARDDIVNATIKGHLKGNSTNSAMILARGQVTPTVTTDVAIGTLTVNGRAEFAQILAGVFPGGAANQNADAQITNVTIGGDWISSSISAGVVAGVDAKYGTADDVKIAGAGVKDVAGLSSKITSLTIGGQAYGSPSVLDHFGIVAENVGSLKVGGTVMTLFAGNGNDDFAIGLFPDFRLNEI